MLSMGLSLILSVGAVLSLLFLILPSIRIIGENELGLVIKRFGKPLTGGNIIAFNGEAGYQADLLMPGWRFKFWVLFKVKKYPWVQVPAGTIGVVIAQVGEPLPIGAKSAVYSNLFGDFKDLRMFVDGKGQKGVQRPVLPPGTTAPIHPIGFLVITKNKVFGEPIDPQILLKAQGGRSLSCENFNLKPDQLDVFLVKPAETAGKGEVEDRVGIVTVLDGGPLPEGDIASRLSGFDDIQAMENSEMSQEESEKFAKEQSEVMEKITRTIKLSSEAALARKVARDAARTARGSGDEEVKKRAEETKKDAEAKKSEAEKAAEQVNEAQNNLAQKVSQRDNKLIEKLLASKNNLHNNYQDFQAFIDHGGKIGLQHDPLLYGAYLLNPFLVRVDLVPMLVVEQGEVAVIKAYVGLVAKDTSGASFKFGSLVRPGHRGIWQEPLRTGKYPLNPRIYQAEIVPTQILTLNWAEAVSKAHNLDQNLNQIEAKSREGFVFQIDLQVQIHVPDTKAPRVISRVGSMANLVNEVLQAAVGNHFRDTLQSMPAVTFIETRQEVQEDALYHIRQKLSEYEVETPGVYIQDVVLPSELVVVLKQREIANQQIRTYEAERQAEQSRVEREKQAGIADRQKDLSSSQVLIAIKTNNADARTQEARGEATYIKEVGIAEGEKAKAIGVGQAVGYTEQVRALGRGNTALVNAAKVLAEGKQSFMPNILVIGGGNGSGSADGLMATLTGMFASVKKSAEEIPTPEKPGSGESIPAPKKDTPN